MQRLDKLTRLRTLAHNKKTIIEKTKLQLNELEKQIEELEKLPDRFDCYNDPTDFIKIKPDNKGIKIVIPYDTTSVYLNEVSIKDLITKLEESLEDLK